MRPEVYKNTIGDPRPDFFWNTMCQHSNLGVPKSMPLTGWIRASDSLSMKYFNSEWMPLE